MYECQCCKQLFNNYQIEAFSAVIEVVKNPTIILRMYFFLEGTGSSGKTFLYNTILSMLQGQGTTVLMVAWTKIAAMLLK